MNRTISPEQLEHEARAKIYWGDEEEAVVKFLRMNGMPAEDAEALVDQFIGERMAALRASGIRKIIVGSGMLCVPIIFWLISMSMGILYVKLFGITVAVGVWGAWKILKGSLMLLFPESETIDLADDQD